MLTVQGSKRSSLTKVLHPTKHMFYITDLTIMIESRFLNGPAEMDTNRSRLGTFNFPISKIFPKGFSAVFNSWDSTFHNIHTCILKTSFLMMGLSTEIYWSFNSGVSWCWDDFWHNTKTSLIISVSIYSAGSRCKELNHCLSRWISEHFLFSVLFRVRLLGLLFIL